MESLLLEMFKTICSDHDPEQPAPANPDLKGEPELSDLQRCLPIPLILSS